ncbi:disulfide bond formation protein B [Nitratireductor soli]|uniref:disulfide bond formation protein B n=1 Tax=Nitratireductor soli TaxID=1670619 RepID=UPI00065E5AB7|nr:disulfide bond formation protein B [Nitratireductor soli]
MSLSAPTGKTQTRAAALLAIGMAATVGTALGFQHLGGYIPCMLCLEQRTPYYIGAPLMLLALIASWLKAPPIVTRGLLAAGGALMLYGMGLGVYHAGVEWSWWEGPADCGVAVMPSGSAGGNLLDQLNAVIPPSCNQAAGRFLGLSFAGWNVLASALWATIALRAAFKR